jgi:hypothetical protein
MPLGRLGGSIVTLCRQSSQCSQARLPSLATLARWASSIRGVASHFSKALMQLQIGMTTDCCADLEERIAELEATTVRKGNRKMSLTITGQIHRMVLWWDDGHSSKTYYGIDNTNSSSRFIFLGSARVGTK